MTIGEMEGRKEAALVRSMGKGCTKLEAGWGRIKVEVGGSGLKCIGDMSCDVPGSRVVTDLSKTDVYGGCHLFL